MYTRLVPKFQQIPIPITNVGISRVLTHSSPRNFQTLRTLQNFSSSRNFSTSGFHPRSKSQIPHNVTKQTRAGIELPPIPGQSSKTRKFLKFFAATVVIGAVAYNTNDSFKSVVDGVYFTSKRIGVVTVASSRCFMIYKSLLSKTYDTKEEEEKAFSEAHLKAALITRKALEANAGIFIKMGQHISALTYLFPSEWTETMIPLQDKCPISSLDSVREMIKHDLGKSLEDIFSEFDPVPLGVASLAQVHRATLKDTGENVAVKIQHPTLAQFVPLDILMTRTVFAMIDYAFPEYPLGWLGDELQSSIYVELDFANEAKNAKKTSDYFKDFYDMTALRVPEVRWAYPRIIAMEYLTGGRPDNIEFINKHNISRADLTSCLAHVFNNMIFTPNVGLHCDPHAGNIAIRPIDNSNKRNWFWFLPWSSQPRNFEIILYDHGLYREIPTDVRRSYAHFWLALLDKDVPAMKKYAKEFAGINDQEFQLFAAAITGRDFENATSNVVSRRSKDEVSKMTHAVSHEGLLSDVMMLLHKMPRVVLLILKTNDLTRYLDEKLDSPLGPERTFLIMASYCAKTVYEEQREQIITKHRKWGITRWIKLADNWWSFTTRQNELVLYDLIMSLKRCSHSA